jgi:hypothetical protein
MGGPANSENNAFQRASSRWARPPASSDSIMERFQHGWVGGRSCGKVAETMPGVRADDPLYRTRVEARFGIMGALKPGFPSEIATPRMEHLWSRAVATSGNRWQMQPL